MADDDPATTRREAVPDVAAELADAGFAEAVEIGRGGFGVVYRCTQPALDRTVAVKVLTADLDDANLERFVREQRAMGRLSGHPNIVNILEVGATTGGRPFIVMQFHAHDSLDAWIRRRGPLGWHDVLRLGVKIAGALATAHRGGTIHRDVKPANILLSEYGEPQLTDFGIARITGGFETGAGFVTGSPAFTAPEVLAGSAPTVASDLYGLGATLFCALTGHAAFERRSGEQVVAQFLRIASQPVPDLRTAGIPDALARAVERAMDRDPHARPESAVAYGEELRDIERRLGVGVDDMALPTEPSGEPPLVTAGPRTQPEVPSVPPTPATKFSPPLRRRVQVPRHRLIELLRAGERRRLIAIHAPAGYGKTTLAVQWAEELVRNGVKVAWLTVVDDDNNLVWFLANLVEAIRRVHPAVTGDLGDVLEEHGESAEQYVLTSLINAIHERREHLAVVVDDWHRVTSPSARGALDFLLEHGCHHLQVVITSRTRSGVPLSRMRMRDELTEIDIDALCFDVSEARSFLVDVAGLDVPNQDVTELRNSTDGWAAALQLACLSLRGSGTPAELASTISGRHHAIADFLTENVLSTLEPDVLRFLLATSVPERVCAGLASALSGEPRGQAMLEDVEARGLFLRRLDQDGDWFRYHPLFAEFLRRRLDRDHPELSTPLHRAASEWFAEHHDLAEAVDHALAAGDPDRAVALVEAGGRTLLEHSQTATLLGLVDKLPPAAVVASPWLQLALAWANVLLHRTDLAQTSLRRVEAALAAAPADTVGIRTEAAVADACARATADVTEGLDALIAPCLAEPGSLPPFVVSAAANIATFSATFRFDFTEAHRWQEWAQPYHQQNGGPYAVMYGHALAGVAAFEQLDLDRAEACFRAARQEASRAGAVHSQAARLAGALLAELLYERGHLADATRLVDESFQLGAGEGVVDVIIARFVVGTRLAALRGDRAAAAQYVDDAAEIAERLRIPRLAAAIETERVVLDLPAGRIAQAPVAFAGRLRPADGIAEITAQFAEEAAIRGLLAGPAADPELACRWAAEWVDRVAGRGRHRAALRADRLLATCLAAAGRTEEATARAQAVLARCAELGMVRFPLDGGPRFAALVATIADGLPAARAFPDGT